MHPGPLFRELVRAEEGATAIEYALIGTLIAVACIVAFTRFSSVTNVLYAVIAAIADNALT